MSSESPQTPESPTPPPGDPFPARGWPVWAKAALIVSLALNVAVIGVVAGYQIKDRENRASGNRQVGWIVRMVPEHRKDFALAHFAETEDRLRAARDDRFVQIERIITAVRAEPFEPTVLAAALEARRAGTVQRRQIVHERLVGLLVAFTSEERQAFADNISARVETWRARRDPALQSGN